MEKMPENNIGGNGQEKKFQSERSKQYENILIDRLEMLKERFKKEEREDEVKKIEEELERRNGNKK